MHFNLPMVDQYDVIFIGSIKISIDLQLNFCTYMFFNDILSREEKNWMIIREKGQKKKEVKK